MSIIPEASAITLRDNYQTTPFPTTGILQDNVSAAYFNLTEVSQLIKALPADTPYIRVVLVLKDDPEPQVTKHVTMTMAGGDSAQNMISAPIKGIVKEVLLADLACPPDCAGHKGKKVIK